MGLNPAFKGLKPWFEQALKMPEHETPIGKMVREWVEGMWTETVMT